MKVDQLFEVFDRAFDYEINQTAHKGTFSFEHEGVGYTTVVVWERFQLGAVLNIDDQGFRNPESIRNYMYTNKLAVVDVQFFTRTDDKTKYIGGDETHNFSFDIVSGIMATVAQMLQDVVDSADVSAVTYSATSGSRERIYERLFQKFQKNSRIGRFVKLDIEDDMGDEPVLLIREEIARDIFEIDKQEEPA